jgi:hypothetical protein
MTLPQILEEWKMPFILASISFALSGLAKAYRVSKRRQSETWSTSYGLVTKATVHEMKHESLLRISYSYPVPEEPYPIPSEFEMDFPSSDEAGMWAEALSGKTIPVRFNPANPWKSVLWDSDLRAVVHASLPALTPSDR